MSLKLVIEDNQGFVIRQIPVTAKSALLIERSDKKRIQVVTNTDFLTKNKIKFSHIADLNFAEIKEKPLNLGHFGTLRLVESIDSVALDGSVNDENKKIQMIAIGIAAAILLLTITIVLWGPKENVQINEDLKQQVVKIVKLIAAHPPVVKTVQMQTSETDATVSKTQPKVSDLVKRSGALAVLGGLKSGANKGGLNLSAANSTAGPGLGGTQGSGEVQKSLYATGLTSAPLGVGHNVSGAGSYGTKGKGGGQAGYGSLSLVGSTGGSTIPLGAEAEVASGLDRSQIDEVIRRNLGQVRFCYEQGLQKNASLSGRVVVGFTVGPSGAVSSAIVESTSIVEKAVEECISMRLKTWKFPTPQGGVSVKVSYPFVLRRQGQG